MDLGIDIGTSEVKALLLDDANCVVGTLKPRCRSRVRTPCGRSRIRATGGPPRWLRLPTCARRSPPRTLPCAASACPDRCMARRCSTHATGCCVRRSLSLGTSGVYFVANAAFSPATEFAVHAFCHCFPDTWHQAQTAGDDDHRFGD
jgi:hypothetical protein